MRNSYSDAGAMLGTVLGIIIAVVLVGSVYISRSNTIKFYNDIDSRISNGYNIFIDGIKVDSENISINKYDKNNIVIDDSGNKILISAQSSARY